MLPTFALRAQSQGFTVYFHAQPQNGSVGIVEVGNHLVDLQDHAIIETRAPHFFYIRRRASARVQGQGFGIIHGRTLVRLQTVLKLAICNGLP